MLRAVTIIILALTISPGAGAQTQSTDSSLLIYAVNVVRTPPQEWTGYGIYLGKGLVLTAAHVVGKAATTKPNVRIASLELPAHVVKEDTFERTDLTLLAIDESKLPI